MTKNRERLQCSPCKAVAKEYRNPFPAVKIIIPKGSEFLYRIKIVPLRLTNKIPSRSK